MRLQKTFTGETRTKQSFKDECDINYMLATFQTGGRAPQTNPYPASYGDFSQTPDYHSALNQVRDAEAAFMQYPSALRSKFHNDPGELLEFIDNEDNRREAELLGLVDVREVPKEDPAEPGPGPTQPDPPQPTDPLTPPPE